MRCPRALVLGLLVFPFVYTSTLPIPCPPHSKPRVRREFRSLPLSIRQRVFDAHWIMRNLTTAEGQARYGPNFISYEDLVVSHACANRDPRCDQGHFGPIFAIFHRALLLQFENSLLAIDPKIGAMPYWNVAFDAKGGKFRDDPRNYIFSEHFFGSKRGDPKANFAVLNGQFARFPVAKYDPMRHGPASNSSLRCLQEDWLRFPGTVSVDDAVALSAVCAIATMMSLIHSRAASSNVRPTRFVIMKSSHSWMVLGSFCSHKKTLIRAPTRHSFVQSISGNAASSLNAHPASFLT